MAKIVLKKNEGRTISSGGLWVFDNEIDYVDGTYINGDIVEVVSYKDDFIGYGYINDNSKIRVRILTRNKEDVIDDEFFINRFKLAWNYRKKVIDTNCCRVVFSDSDRLPGLIVDLCINVLSKGFYNVCLNNVAMRIRQRLMKNLIGRQNMV